MLDRTRKIWYKATMQFIKHPLKNHLWHAEHKGSKRHPEWDAGGDIKVLNPDGTIKEIIPIKTYRKTPKKLKLLPEKPNARKTEEYWQWREKVLRRDKRTCVLCGSKDWPNAHHIERWVDNVKLRYAEENGVTLCMICHNKYHGPHRQEFPQYINERLIAYVGQFYPK